MAKLLTEMSQIGRGMFVVLKGQSTKYNDYKRTLLEIRVLNFLPRVPSPMFTRNTFIQSYSKYSIKKIDKEDQ